MTVSLFGLVILLLIVGFLSYLVGLAPVDQPYKQIAKAVLLFILVIYAILVVWGLLGGEGKIPHTLLGS